MRQKTCPHCHDDFTPTGPFQPCCSKSSCRAAELAKHSRKKREKAEAERISPATSRKTVKLHSTTTPTKAEREWMDAIVRLGCIVCHLQGRGYVPAAVHHLKEGNRRMGHLFTIPLCDPGHHQNAPAGSGEVSRHPNKARFEAQYGTEMELLEKTKQLVQQRRRAV